MPTDKEPLPTISQTLTGLSPGSYGVARVRLTELRRERFPHLPTWSPWEGHPTLANPPHPSPHAVRDQDGDLWITAGDGPFAVWVMPDHDPEEHEEAAGRGHIWAELATEYGPLTLAENEGPAPA